MFTGTTNHFIRNPPKVVIERPSGKSQLRVFLGDVPAKVLSAARGDAGGDILREFYGPQWRAKIGRTEISGGQTEISGGIDDLDDIEFLLGETAPTSEPRHTAGAAVEFIDDVHIFPEDKITELRDKIFLATDIPPYRQHIYWVRGERAIVPYQIYADGIYTVDIRATPKRHVIAGAPIDKTLYNLRETIRVEARDQFTILGDLGDESSLASSVGPTIYVRDLADYIAPHAQMVEIVNDTYQFDLFYYGFVIKFWPQLTQECFYDYIMRESELQHKYPDLAKTRQTLASIYRAEADIIVRDYRNTARALGACSKMTMAITQMTAIIHAVRTSVNIRNLFDRLRVTRCVPEIHAYVELDGKRYLLRKRHIRNGSDIQFPSGALMKNGIVIAISLRKADQESYHARTGVSTMENEQSRHLFLNIWPNGRYYIRTVWNEEDEFSFDDVMRVMKRFTDPIIGSINSFGKYIFIAGGPLPLVTKQNVSYSGLTICLFWKRVMLENTFKLIRAAWESYMRARLAAPRNVQQYDKYEFTFRKGMYQFDTSSIERIVSAAGSTVLTNQYSYLSNNSVKQKWDQNYDGRIVRMSHRTTDLRFEIVDVRETEFAIFHKFVAGFVYAASVDAQIKESMTTTRSYKDVKKLRKLREQDPELYNLKKYGSKKVYSIICQNQRQPLIYTADEIAQMSSADVKRLTQYWNFTLNKPAYYGCPTKKYPHLSFMVGVHPKHYCLPCCNKLQQNAVDNKRAKINATCMKNHKLVDVDGLAEADTSRHIMAYGKDMDIGRISRLPAQMSVLLFKTAGDGAESSPLGHFLYGVAQHMPGVENIGCLFAAAEAVGQTPSALIKRIIELVPHYFPVLLNGTLGEYFRDAADLADTMRELFVAGKLFTREARRFTQWPELIIESLHLAGISVFTFIDADGSGSAINLHVSGGLLAEILSLGSESFSADSAVVVILKRRNYYYPIFALDVDEFFKRGLIHARTGGSAVVKLLVAMVTSAGADDAEAKLHDYRALAIALGGSKYKISKKYVGAQNLCYGVEVTGQSGKAFLPCDYSNVTSDGVPVDFGAPTRSGLSRDFLVEVIGAVNLGMPAGYAPISLDQDASVLATQSGKTIGAITPSLTYYWDDATEDSTDLTESSMPARNVRYDPMDVNRKILARSSPTPDARTTRLGEALYSNYQYQLFLLEFVNYLNDERNVDVRTRLRALITSTNFKKDLGDFKTALRELVGASDLATIHSQLGVFYQNLDRTALLATIDSTRYEFDRMTLNALRAMPVGEMHPRLKEIASAFAVERDLDVSAIKFPNIYMPCGDLATDTGYCDGRKLIVNEPLDGLVDILAYDLTNSLKLRYLFDMWADTTIDWLNFTRWPTEHITIYKLTE